MSRTTAERWTGYVLALPVLFLAALAFGTAWLIERVVGADTRFHP